MHDEPGASRNSRTYDLLKWLRLPSVLNELVVGVTSLVGLLQTDHTPFEPLVCLAGYKLLALSSSFNHQM